MSDIQLTASIDFKGAEKQVDAFVKETKVKLSDVMAKASAPGGSRARVSVNSKNAVENALRSMGIPSDRDLRDALAKAGDQTLQFRRRMHKQLFDETRRAADEQLRFRVKMNGQQFALEKRDAETTFAFRRRMTQQRIKEEKSAEEAFQRYLIRMREQSRSRLNQNLGWMFPDENDVKTRAASLRKHIEKVYPAAGGQLARSVTLAQRNAALDAIFPNERDVAVRASKLRSHIEKLYSPAGGQALRQSGSLADMIMSRVSGGTGQQNQMAKFYNDAAEAAERAARSATKANTAFSTANTRAIGSAENRALGMNLRIGRQLNADPELQAQLTSRVNAALTAYADTIKQFGARSIESAAAQARFQQEMTRVNNTIAKNGGLLKTLNTGFGSLKDNFSDISIAGQRLNRFLINTQVALSALAGFGGFREILQANVDLQKFTNTLRAVSGDPETFANSMSFLRKTADEVGISIAAVGNSFARFSLAASAAGFETSEVQTAFTQLVGAARNFGLSAADTQGVIRALEQSLSKGKFMAEEVRLQLGDRLPIAMQALQRAVGVSSAELNKMFEAGSLSTEKFFVPFVEQLFKMSGGSVALGRSSQALQAQIDRLGTAFLFAAGAIGEGGFNDAVANSAKTLADFMNSAGGQAVFTTVGASIKFVVDNIDLLITAAVIYAGTHAPALAAAMTGVSGVALRQVAIWNFMTASMTRTAAATALLTNAMRGAVAMLGGPLGVSIAAVATGMYLYSNRTTDATKLTESFTQAQTSFQNSLASTGQSLESLKKKYDEANESAKSLMRVQEQKALRDQQQVQADARRATNSLLFNNGSRTSFRAESLLESSGLADEFQTARFNFRVSDSPEAFNELVKSLDELAKKTNTTKGPLIDLIDEVLKYAKANNDAQVSIDSINGVLRAFNGQIDSSEAKVINFTNAVAATKEEMKRLAEVGRRAGAAVSAELNFNRDRERAKARLSAARVGPQALEEFDRNVEREDAIRAAREAVQEYIKILREFEEDSVNAAESLVMMNEAAELAGKTFDATNPKVNKFGSFINDFLSNEKNDKLAAFNRIVAQGRNEFEEYAVAAAEANSVLAFLLRQGVNITAEELRLFHTALREMDPTWKQQQKEVEEYLSLLDELEKEEKERVKNRDNAAKETSQAAANLMLSIEFGSTDSIVEAAQVLDTAFNDLLANSNSTGEAFSKLGKELWESGQGAEILTTILDSFLGRSEEQTRNAKIGGKIGQVAGQAIGTAIGGKLGGEIGKFVGKIGGNLVGGLFGGNKARDLRRNKELTDLGNAINSFMENTSGISATARELSDLSNEFTRLVKEATRLGQPIADLTRAYERQRREIIESANDNNRGRLFSATNNPADGLPQLLRQHERYIKEAIEAELDLSLARRANAAELANFFEQFTYDQLVAMGDLVSQLDLVKARIRDITATLNDQLDNMISLSQEAASIARSQAQALRSVAQSLRDQLRGYEVDETRSPLDQLNNSQRQFEETWAKVQQGDTAALEQLGSVADQYREIARSFFGSTAQFDEIDRSIKGILAQAAITADVRASGLELIASLAEVQVEILGDIREVLNSDLGQPTADAVANAIADNTLTVAEISNIVAGLDTLDTRFASVGGEQAQAVRESISLLRGDVQAGNLSAIPTSLDSFRGSIDAFRNTQIAEYTNALTQAGEAMLAIEQFVLDPNGKIPAAVAEAFQGGWFDHTLNTRVENVFRDAIGEQQLPLPLTGQITDLVGRTIGTVALPSTSMTEQARNIVNAAIGISNALGVPLVVQVDGVITAAVGGGYAGRTMADVSAVRDYWIAEGTKNGFIGLTMANVSGGRDYWIGIGLNGGYANLSMGTVSGHRDYFISLGLGGGFAPTETLKERITGMFGTAVATWDNGRGTLVSRIDDIFNRVLGTPSSDLSSALSRLMGSTSPLVSSISSLIDVLGKMAQTGASQASRQAAVAQQDAAASAFASSFRQGGNAAATALAGVSFAPVEGSNNRTDSIVDISTGAIRIADENKGTQLSRSRSSSLATGLAELAKTLEKLTGGDLGSSIYVSAGETTSGYRLGNIDRSSGFAGNDISGISRSFAFDALNSLQGADATALDILKSQDWTNYASALALAADEIYRKRNPLPAFAEGGMHSGGLRLVGENGPELEVTGPARYFNTAQTMEMLYNSSSNDAEIVSMLRELVDTQRAAAAATIQAQKETTEATREVAKNTTVNNTQKLVA